MWSSAQRFKLAILLSGAVVEPPKTPTLFLTGAVETETNLDSEDEDTEERMDNLKTNSVQALERLGRHRAFNA